MKARCNAMHRTNKILSSVLNKLLKKKHKHKMYTHTIIREYVLLSDLRKKGLICSSLYRMMIQMVERERESPKCLLYYDNAVPPMTRLAEARQSVYHLTIYFRVSLPIKCICFPFLTIFL